MVLPEEPVSRGMPGNRDVNHRPPSMIQQHMGGGAPISFAPQAHYPQQNYSVSQQYYAEQSPFTPQQFGDQSYYGHSNGGFNAGQALPMPPPAWAPVTPHSSQPFFAPMGESPMASPVTPAHYDSAYDAVGRLVRQNSNGAYLERSSSTGGNSLGSPTSPTPSGTLSRQPSINPAIPLLLQPGASRALSREPSLSSPSTTTPPTQLEVPAEAHYVDLSRASVSPFQAAQYAEISEHLQTEPPVPLPSPIF